MVTPGKHYSDHFTGVSVLDRIAHNRPLWLTLLVSTPRIDEFLMAFRQTNAMEMTQPSSATRRRMATLSLADGTAFFVTVSPGCEAFVGRFVRLNELRTPDHVIRFRDLAPAS